MDYTQYDYNALTNRITNLVKDARGWGDGYASSTGQTLIQLIAQMTDELNYMLERRTQENFLPTATLSSSVLSIASSLSYRPRRAVSASGTMSIQLVDNKGFAVQALGDVTLPKYTQILYNKKNFVNNQDVLIKKGDIAPIEFPVLEGIKQTQTFSVSDPSGNLFQNNYILLPNYRNIEENSFLVYDTDGVYTDVTKQTNNIAAIEALSFAGPNDKVYDIRITNDGMLILFGNGTFGKKPDKDITLQWVESSGSNVDVQAVGLDFSLQSQTLTDNLNLTPPNEYFYSLTNVTPIDNGLDAESIQDVKRRTPDFVRSANRAVTKGDYEFWVKHSGIGGIVDSRAYGQEEIGINVTNMNNVHIVYLNENGTTLSLNDLQKLKNYMNVYKELTTYLIYQKAELVPIQVNVTSNRNTIMSISDSEIYNLLYQFFVNYFSLKEGSLGGHLHYSELVKSLQTYKIQRNGTTYNLNNFVDIKLRALKSFDSPATYNSNTITISSGTVGDVYTLTLSGVDYSYTMVSGDTSTTIATNLTSTMQNIGNTTVTSNGNVISINAVSGTSYTLSNLKSSVPTNIPVLIDVQLMTPTVSSPQRKYTSNTINVTAGTFKDLYTLTINGTNYTYMMASGDTASNIASGIANAASSVPNVTVTANSNTITLSTTSGSYYTLSIDSSTNLSNISITSSQVYTQTFASGYVEIIDVHGNVIATDDGNGNINGGTINYTTGLARIPTMVAGSYYIRYLQDEYMNFVCNPNSALVYSLPKAKFSDTQEQLSTIKIESS